MLYQMTNFTYIDPKVYIVTDSVESQRLLLPSWLQSIWTVMYAMVHALLMTRGDVTRRG